MQGETMELEEDREFAKHRAAFAKKVRMDRQKVQALWQFGDGKEPPPDPEPDQPTRMVA